jgi:hypothetical protein
MPDVAAASSWQLGCQLPVAVGDGKKPGEACSASVGDLGGACAAGRETRAGEEGLGALKCPSPAWP